MYIRYCVLIFIEVFVKVVVEVMSCTCNDRVEEVTKPDRLLHKKHEDVTEAVSQKNRKRCCPYNFDSTFCRTIGDRLLCGYNRNIGNPRGTDKVNLQNGCIIRGGRLECGYHEQPYMNSRRPPSWDYQIPADGDDNNDNKHETDNEVDKHEAKPSTNVQNKLSLKKVTNNVRGSTRCLEIRDRIVCRKV